MTQPAGVDLIAKADKLLQDITPGEWTDGWLEHGGDAVCAGDVLVAGGMAPVDAAFVAAAPQLVTALSAALAACHEERTRFEKERDELLLDRHEPHRLAPCGHYRVFVMPCLNEDGSESDYCMQCNRDSLQQTVAALTEERDRLAKELGDAHELLNDGVQTADNDNPEKVLRDLTVPERVREAMKSWEEECALREAAEADLAAIHLELQQIAQELGDELTGKAMELLQSNDRYKVGYADGILMAEERIQKRLSALTTIPRTEVLGEAFGDTKREVFDQSGGEPDPHVGVGASAEMPRYRCHKEVWALKIASIHHDHPGCVLPGDAMLTPEDTRYAPFLVRSEYVEKHKPEAGGYFVVYKDGYKSFSPAEAFEEGYTRL